MIKLLIAGVILASAAVIWLRVQWAVGKNKKVAGIMIEGLKNGSYTPASFEESLNMQIRSMPFPGEISTDLFKRKLVALTNTKLREKFTIQYAQMEHDKGIVIAEAVMKDNLPSYNSNRQVDLTFPCWLLVEIDPSGQELYFKSSMPESKDHHYLLEDISEGIYAHCVSI